MSVSYAEGDGVKDACPATFVLADEDGRVRKRLASIQIEQEECLGRIGHLEGESREEKEEEEEVDGERKHELDGGGGLLTASLQSGRRRMTEKDVQEEIYAYQSTLNQTALFLDTAMKHLLRRQIRRECASSQTDSTSITAHDEEGQTTEDIEADYHVEKVLYSLPDLEDEIAHLRIDMETQTDLQMDHFSPDSHTHHHPRTSKDDGDNHVIIIYRNPSVASFLKPYLVGVGGTVLACCGLYSIARFTLLHLNIHPPSALAVPA